MNQRVFFHTPEPASSPALYVDELLKALTASGMPVHLICPENHVARASFEANPLITLHLSARRETRRSDSALRKAWSNLRFLLSSCSTLLQAIRRGDLVHFQYVLHFPFGALFFLCALLRRSTIAFTVHDPLPHKWLLPFPFRVLETSALAWSYRVSDALLVHSESGKRTLAAHFPAVAHKIFVIAHGPYQLADTLRPIPRSEPLEVLLFGALRENKGAHLAIEAIQQLYEEGLPVRLTIAGAVVNRKEQSYWDKCRQLIARCPAPVLVIEQFIPHERLAELFGNCHCFLLPYTSFSSDSGVAFMALANGRPIVCTTSGGLGDLLEASGGGLAIRQATPAGVASALRQAVNLGPAKLDCLGKRGQTWVLEECGWTKIARQTRQIYAQLSGSTQYEASYVEQQL